MKKMYKRITDITISIIVLIIMSPIIFLTFVLILLFDLHNPIFTQYRAGLNQKKFKLFKFKSMKLDPDSNEMIVTKIGKYIRIIKVDEILQLINVLKNEMSIVGPRPLYLEFNDHYKKRHIYRMMVKPGITGLAQIKVKDSTNWNSKFNYDVIYVKNLSLKLDMYIYLKTIKLVMKSTFQKKNRPLESTNYKKNFFENYCK